MVALKNLRSDMIKFVFLRMNGKIKLEKSRVRETREETIARPGKRRQRPEPVPREWRLRRFFLRK